jgi:bromodomain-containing factor 1
LFFFFAVAIAMMESQIETMKSNIESLRTSKIPKEKKKKEKKEKAPVASTSKAPPKQPKAPAKKKSKKNITDDDVLTFEQKKDLSESIGKLDGARLERVIQIIHEGVPEIRDVSLSFFLISSLFFPCPCTYAGSDHTIT